MDDGLFDDLFESDDDGDDGADAAALAREGRKRARSPYLGSAGADDADTAPPPPAPPAPATPASHGAEDAPVDAPPASPPDEDGHGAIDKPMGASRSYPPLDYELSRACRACPLAMIIYTYLIPRASQRARNVPPRKCACARRASSPPLMLRRRRRRRSRGARARLRARCRRCAPRLRRGRVPTAKFASTCALRARERRRRVAMTTYQCVPMLAAHAALCGWRAHNYVNNNSNYVNIIMLPTYVRLGNARRVPRARATCGRRRRRT